MYCSVDTPKIQEGVHHDVGETYRWLFAGVPCRGGPAGPHQWEALPQIAQDLGMTTETLRKWLKQADLDEGKRQDGLTTEEQEELRRLRRENRILREEREILVKVTMSRCDIPSDENALAPL